MTVTINGTNYELDEEATILDALTAIGMPLDARGVAVAVGYDVIRRGDWAAHKLAEGDTVEVVTATQGG